MKFFLLTGASGFLGKRIVQYLENLVENQLSLAFRKNNFSAKNNQFFIWDIDNSTDFSAALLGQDIVIHTAARVHIMGNIRNSVYGFWPMRLKRVIC